MLLSIATLTLTAALAPAEPQPLRPVEAVQILADGAAEPLCRGARLENGRIVAPLLPLVGVKAMKVRGADGGEKPILSVTTPNHPWLLVLNTEAPGKQPRPETASPEPMVGLTMMMLPGVKLEPAASSVRVNYEGWRPGYRSVMSTAGFSRDSLGAVAVSKSGVGLMLVAGTRDAKQLSIFAVLDAESLAANGRTRPAARWGESTDNGPTREVARAILAADAAALDAVFRGVKDGAETPVYRALMPLAVELLSEADRAQTVLDVFKRDDTLARDPRTRIFRATELIKSRQYQAVVDSFDSIGSPTGMDEYLTGCALEGLKSPFAEGLYTLAVEKSPGLHQAWCRLGMVMVQIGDAEKAARCAMQCLKYDGTGASAGLVASALEQAEFHAVAEPVRRAAIQAEPADPARSAALVANLLGQFKPRQALEVVKGCEALGVRSRELFESALYAAVLLKDADLVRERGDLYVKKYPGEQASALYAEQWMRLERAEDALSLLEPALKETPASVRLHTGRAWCLLQLGRHAEGLAEARRILQLKPADPRALDYAVNASFELGDLDAAEEYAETYAKSTPKELRPLLHLARIASKRGDDKKLDAALARLRALDPQYADEVAKTLRPGK